MAEPPPREPSGERDPFAARVLGGGVRAGQRIAGATGVDQALDSAVEEAIVRAMESPAVERALIRLADDGRLQVVLEEVVAKSDVEDLVDRAISSEAADRIWEEILASDKAQMLVERVADAPEVRAAIAQQGLGLLSDVGMQVRRLTRPLDRVVERVARALLGRPKQDRETGYAGLVTRLLAAAIDTVLLFGGLSIASGIIAAVISAVFGQGDGLSALGVVAALLAAGTIAGWILISFWALAGQTPGMRFLAIRLDADGERRIGGRLALRRLLAVPLALLTFGLGFLAILIDDDRRGWHDRIAGTTVLYDDSNEVAPYARAPDT